MSFDAAEQRGFNRRTRRIDSDTRSVEPGASMSTTETKVSHTPGALRAALLFDEQLVAAGLPSDYLSKRSRIEAVAAKIDQETAAPDMLQALEYAREELMYYHAEAQKQAFVIGQIALKGSALLAIEAAIQKAKGGAA